MGKINIAKEGVLPEEGTRGAREELWDEFIATRGIVIAVGRTGVLNVVDLKDLSKVTTVQSIYDMPINYQEKFGLLHIVDEEQAVENVGIKWTRTQDECKSYFLVDGDTVAY